MPVALPPGRHHRIKEGLAVAHIHKAKLPLPSLDGKNFSVSGVEVAVVYTGNFLTNTEGHQKGRRRGVVHIKSIPRYFTQMGRCARSSLKMLPTILPRRFGPWRTTMRK
jgi:hypothetical protein